MDISQKKCVPCEVGGLPFNSDDIAKYVKDVPEWKIVDNKKLSRTFKFKDFRKALDFVNAVGEIAEKEGHHPDITINYNKVTMELTTHAVGGLTENDFIVAAKIAKLP